MPVATPTAERRPHDRQLRLADGRLLGYAEFGDPAGTPVLFFHGLGTSRLICPPDEGVARGLAVRLIAVDRPGIGLSEPLPGRRLLDWPADVVQLAEQLGLRRFAIVGWSGGGPYALACGRSLPERVSAIALVSAPAPLAGVPRAPYLRRFHRNAARAAGRAPWMIRFALWHWGRSQRRDAARFFEQSVGAMCAADQEVLAEPGLRNRMIANSAEIYRHGGRGLYDEALVLARRWGFTATEVTPPVQLWHGALDQVVPVSMAEYLAATLPDCRPTIQPDDGHHLLYRRWPEILAGLVSA